MDDLTGRNVAAMRHLEQSAETHRTFADRMAAFVATFCGSITFVWIHVAIFVVWIAFNTMAGFPHFDPYPFTFLTLCVSLEAIFLSAFILISQNFEMRVSDRRNQLDLQINLLTEQENTKILQLLEGISKKVARLQATIPRYAHSSKPRVLRRLLARSKRLTASMRRKPGINGSCPE